MSYTTVKAVWPGEKVEDFEELRNGYGSAPVIWNDMSVRYLGCEEYECMHSRKIDLLWPLYKHLGIPLHQRAVLTMTYDRALVFKRDYVRAAEDIRAYMKDFPNTKGGVHHWSRIAEIFESNPDVPAIGFQMTSVSDDLFVGDWDEEREEYGPPDWARFWNIYERLDQYVGVSAK